MGGLPECLQLLIRDASVIKIVRDNARRPAVSSTEMYYLYRCDNPNTETRLPSHEGFVTTAETRISRRHLRSSRFKNLQLRTLDRWQSSASPAPLDFEECSNSGESKSSILLNKDAGSMCPRSPRIPMRRTSDDSKEAANSRKPLNLPVRRRSEDIEEQPKVRVERRCTNSSCDSSASVCDDNSLSTVIGKVLHELQALELLSSQEEGDDEDLAGDTRQQQIT